MYRVTCLHGGTTYTLHDPESMDLRVFDDELETEDSLPGSFRFSVSCDHPYIDKIVGLSSDIRVYDGDVEIFRGRPVNDGEDLYRTRSFRCEGELAFLYDSIQPRRELHGITPAAFFTLLVEEHNQQVQGQGPIDKTFQIGRVTITDSSGDESLLRYTNRETTLDDIRDKLIDRLGGHLMVRIANGVRYLDLLSEVETVSNQTIQLGENLLSYAKDTDYTEIATACIPLGAMQEETEINALDAYLTVASVNNGSEVIQLASAVQRYGFICKVLNLSNYTTAANLKAAGERWLTDGQYENMTLELTAVDLHGLGYEVQAIRTNTKIRVISAPHGMDRYFNVAKRVYHLTQPELDSVTCGMTTQRKSFTDAANKNAKEISAHNEELHELLVEKVEDTEAGLRSTIEQLAGHIKLEVSGPIVDGQTVYSSLVLRVTTDDGEYLSRGQVVISGNVDVNGDMSVNALYSVEGDIADLAVDRLRTSRRIVRYLDGDDSDDDYLDIHDECIQFITGTCTGSTEQATNPNGELLYWETNPAAEGTYIGADGYYHRSDGTRIFFTTRDTGYAVMQYSYTDVVKAEYKFDTESDGQGGTIKVPVFIMGAGNAAGTNQARIWKGTDGLHIMYTPNQPAQGDPIDDIGIVLRNDGVMELHGYSPVELVTVLPAVLTPGKIYAVADS